ncbi:MAG TPA: hypothetical protein PK868_03275 [Phycicoccus sp.]|nr:hypothetical protein [Phycicoccus sp.]HQK30622.1 hypothetical protein [Phycicoccus sp.]
MERPRGRPTTGRTAMPPRPTATRRLALPWLLLGLAYAAVLFILARTQGQIESPPMAFLFFIGSVGVVLLVLQALVVWAYRPLFPLASQVSILAMILAPIGLIFIIATAAMLHADSLLSMRSALTALAVFFGTALTFVAGLISYRAIEHPDREEL